MPERSQPNGEVRPWTEQKVRDTIGDSLARLIGPTKLNAIADGLEHRRQLMLGSYGDMGNPELSPHAGQYYEKAKLAVRELESNLHMILQFFDEAGQNRPNDYEQLLTELERAFPKTLQEKARRRGGVTKGAIDAIASRHASWVRAILKYTQVELSDEDREETIIIIVARWINDGYPATTYTNAKNIKQLVKDALDKSDFFDRRE